MFSASPNRLFGILAKEGSVTTKTPGQVSQLIRDRRATNEKRPFLVIVEGSLEWLRKYQRAVDGADFIVYCADEETLRRHGVEIVDEGWDQRGGQLPQIDQFLLERPRKERTLGRIAGGEPLRDLRRPGPAPPRRMPRGVGLRRHPPASEGRLLARRKTTGTALPGQSPTPGIR